MGVARGISGRGALATTGHGEDLQPNAMATYGEVIPPGTV
jgi:hypothetical protein